MLIPFYFFIIWKQLKRVHASHIKKELTETKQKKTKNNNKKRGQVTEFDAKFTTRIISCTFVLKSNHLIVYIFHFTLDWLDYFIYIYMHIYEIMLAQNSQ